MPRLLRKEIDRPGTLYHIVCRGNNQRKIFWRLRDYKKFLKILKRTKEMFPFYLYSFSLLPNHYHLAIETKEISLSKIMHQINTAYVKYAVTRYQRTGHIFQGRFYSSVVDKENYFWELSRYIDLNALRAGLVEKITGYRWTSYRVYAKMKNEFPKGLIDEEKFLEYWDEGTRGGIGGLEEARERYLKFINESAEILREGEETKGKTPFAPNKNFF